MMSKFVRIRCFVCLVLLTSLSGCSGNGDGPIVSAKQDEAKRGARVGAGLSIEEAQRIAATDGESIQEVLGALARLVESREAAGEDVQENELADILDRKVNLYCDANTCRVKGE